MTICCSKQSQAVYRPRRPEKTALFQTIKKYYKTWCRSKPLPKYIEKEFTGYLGCGILAHGFACIRCNSCCKEYLLGFSCKGRGICPSCNTRAMVETAANLAENIIPTVPVRQWVISFPKRIRPYLQNHATLQAVLRIVVDEIHKRLTFLGPDIPNLKIGAVSFIQLFGNTLNFHPHFHLIVADGLFRKDEEDLLFYQTNLSPDDIIDTQESIRKRVLRYFSRRGYFDKESVSQMLTYENSGFSLNAKVRIGPCDRKGLERLLRYCARPPFASENLKNNGPWIQYRLPKPSHKGQRFIQLEPLELIDRIAKFIPLPRRHRRHYHGVFAPNSPLRKIASRSAQKRPKPTSLTKSADKTEKVSLGWAKLIARIYEVNPLICPCGKEMKIVAFVTNPTEIKRILKSIGWPTAIPQFDPPDNFPDWQICQLLPNTEDGFPDEISQVRTYCGPDPPNWDNIDPPHEEEYIDPPHPED